MRNELGKGLFITSYRGVRLIRFHSIIWSFCPLDWFSLQRILCCKELVPFLGLKHGNLSVRIVSEKGKVRLMNGPDRRCRHMQLQSGTAEDLEKLQPKAHDPEEQGR